MLRSGPLDAGRQEEGAGVFGSASELPAASMGFSNNHNNEILSYLYLYYIILDAHVVNKITIKIKIKLIN